MKDRIRLEIAKFMEHNDVLTKLENGDRYCVENALTELLTNHETTLANLIFRFIEREYHKEDVLNEIEYLNEDWNSDEPEKQISLDDKTLEHIVNDYEEMLGDSEDWHFCLIEAIRRNQDA